MLLGLTRVEKQQQTEESLEVVEPVYFQVYMCISGRSRRRDGYLGSSMMMGNGLEEEKEGYML